MPYQLTFIEVSAFQYLIDVLKLGDGKRWTFGVQEGFVVISPMNATLNESEEDIYIYASLSAVANTRKRRAGKSARHFLLQAYKTLVDNEIDYLPLTMMKTSHSACVCSFANVRVIELQPDAPKEQRAKWDELPIFRIKLQDEFEPCLIQIDQIAKESKA